MKKLILTLFASAALVSCSTNSSSDNPSSGGLLLKTVTNNYGTSSFIQTYTYNGNKAVGYISSNGDYGTISYIGDFIQNTSNFYSSNNSTDIESYTYANNLLSSLTANSTHNNVLDTWNSVFTYNSDGSITENRTSTSNTGYVSHSMTKRYYSQGNCIKEENYNTVNSVLTLISISNSTYDTKNFPFKNVTGFYMCQNPQGASINNKISEITTNASGVVSSISQDTYQYNSQDYPISGNSSYTSYLIDPTTGISVPSTPNISSVTFTYY